VGVGVGVGVGVCVCVVVSNTAAPFCMRNSYQIIKLYVSVAVSVCLCVCVSMCVCARAHACVCISFVNPSAHSLCAARTSPPQGVYVNVREYV